jgi:hypothetical protein
MNLSTTYRHLLLRVIPFVITTHVSIAIPQTPVIPPQPLVTAMGRLATAFKDLCTNQATWALLKATPPASLSEINAAYDTLIHFLNDKIVKSLPPTPKRTPNWNALATIPATPAITTGFYDTPASFLGSPDLLNLLLGYNQQWDTESAQTQQLAGQLAQKIHYILQLVSRFNTGNDIMQEPNIAMLTHICCSIILKSSPPAQPPQSVPSKSGNQQLTDQITQVAVNFKNYCSDTLTLATLKGEYTAGFIAKWLSDPQEAKIVEIANTYGTTLYKLADAIARVMHLTRADVLIDKLDQNILATISPNQTIIEGFYDIPLTFLTAQPLTDLISDYAQNWDAKGLQYKSTMKRIAENITTLIRILAQFHTVVNANLYDNQTVQKLYDDCQTILESK